MATILELAEHSNLPAETVLRAVNGESASSEARDRVAEAIAALGAPSYRRFALPSTELVQPRSLFEEVAARLARERRERVDDVELMTELLIEGWRSVDRRLGRIEKVLARLEGPPAEEPAEVVRMDDFHRAG